MSFASDKLWDGYLRKNMAIIVSKVKENIEAKRETNGNFDAMMLLLECLRRRDNWPEQLIAGLEACEHPTIAAEMRAEYNALIGVNNSNSGSPQANVQAHVHPAPAASPVGAGNIQAALTPPAPTPPVVINPEPAAQKAPTHHQAPQSAPVQVVFPPEPVPEPSLSTQDPDPLLPSTPPPSPETPRAEAANAPQEDVHPHQKPEENTESNIQDASGVTSLPPAQASSGNKVMTPPQQHHPVPTCETDPSPRPDAVQAPVTTNNKPLQSASPSRVNSGLNDGSSVLIMTQEKLPVQDTAPPVHKAPSTALLPEILKPAAPQIVKSNLQTEPASTEPRCDDDDESVCLSKPDQLISFHPENQAIPPDQDSHPPAELYSGNSERLEFSEAASDAASSAPLCHVNGTAPTHSEPEENHYESPNQSFEVIENVVQYAEMPSVPNLDGQATASHRPTNGRISEPPGFTNAASNSANIEGYSPSQPPSAGVSPEFKSQPNSEKNTVRQSNTTKYILIAAGVGVVMLMMARRFGK